MGTWGIKTFEDDDARDWIYKLEDTDDPLVFLRDSLKYPETNVYFDSIRAKLVLCASEIIYGLLQTPREGVPENAVDWINSNKGLDVSDLKDLCIKGIDRVLADNSELKDLWSENTDLYQQWQDNVRSLQNAF